MNDPHIYDRRSADFHEALDACQQRSDEINAGVSCECSSTEPNTQQGQTPLGDATWWPTLAKLGEFVEQYVTLPQDEELSRTEAGCEWFDSLPKPPEPLPWLPQEKATDKHPFE